MSASPQSFVFSFGKFFKALGLVFRALLRRECVLLLLVFGKTSLFAEGTKELAPNSSDVTMLYTNEITFGNFAAYDGPESGRLYFSLENPNSEQVFFGFSQSASNTNGSDGNFLTTAYYFRVKDPNGNVVYGPQVINSTNANANTWALAAAGPAPIVGSGGYTPFTFNPTGLSAGDYYIEFSRNTNTPSTGQISVKFWDITVATTGSSPEAINGRLWSKRWSLRTPSISQGADPTYTYFDRPFNGQVFLYTFDGFVSKIDFNGSGFRGLSFNLAYNEDGVITSGDFEENRRSIEDSNNTLPLYQIFVNDPDSTIYPSGNIGFVQTDPLVINCDPSNLCISVSTTEMGHVFLLLDFDNASGAGLYDQNTADVLLMERIEIIGNETAPFERCIPWNGQDGLGNTVAANAVIPLYLTYAQGMVHFPVYDVEYNVTGYTVEPVRPLLSGFTQELFYDDTDITDAPGNGAPKDRVNGCTPPCHAYTNIDYGNLNTINTWWYTNQDFIISIDQAACVMNAFLDLAVTVMETPVVIDVLDNDVGNDLDPASVTNTGLLEPSSGGISINPVTGEITYTPLPGFVGIDSFEYRVCEMGGSPCDTATVWVIVNCETVVGNIIKGTVFLDANADGSPNVGENGEQNVTVSLYEDLNGNGTVDVGDALVNTLDTDTDGNFSFSVSTPSSGVFTYNDVPSSGIAINGSTTCTAPIVRTFTVTQNTTITDVNLGLNAAHIYRGDIRITLESPSGTVVQLVNGGSNDSNDNYDLILDSSSGNALNDGNADDTNTPHYDRTASPNNSLNAFNGQNAQGVWTLRICDTYPSADNGTYNRSRLIITGIDTVDYVMAIDLNDLPCGATLTTPTYQTASFTVADQIDCANNFGFLPSPTTAVAGSNSPVCIGSDINLSETGGTAVSWWWSGPSSFTSSQQNPTISVATLSNAGQYFVTVTGADGCTSTGSTTVVVNSLSNAGTAVANDSICINGSGLSLIDLFQKLTGEDAGGVWSVVSGTPGTKFNAGSGTLNPNGLPIDTYIFRYTVAGNAPCPDDTADYILVIYRCCPPEICLPMTSSRNN